MGIICHSCGFLEPQKALIRRNPSMHIFIDCASVKCFHLFDFPDITTRLHQHSDTGIQIGIFSIQKAETLTIRFFLTLSIRHRYQVVPGTSLRTYEEECHTSNEYQSIIRKMKSSINLEGMAPITKNCVSTFHCLRLMSS